jgi:FkbM family methyltransferase
MAERRNTASVPLYVRLMGSLIRALPPGSQRMLSRSLLGGTAHRLLKNSSSGRQWVMVEAGVNKGMRFLLDLRQGEYIYAWGLHEPEVQAILPEVVRPGQVAYDLGANIGLVSVALARLVGPSGRVIAFEPVCPEVLEAVAVENGLSQITVIRRAVADHVGEGVMLDWIDILSPVNSAAGKVVPLTTIDAFVYDEGFSPPDFMKIDIEGAEGLALSGMSRVVTECRPTLLIEIHGSHGGRPSQAEPVWNWLSAHSYDVLQYLGNEWRKPAKPFEGRCLAR